ncbi:hypothetical protein D3C84_842990 [compost metagenome]
MPGTTAETNRIIEPFSSDIDTVVVGRQTQVDVGITGLEIRQSWQQPTDSERTHRPHCQHLTIMPAFKTFQRLGNAVEAFAQYRQQGLAFAGQHQTPWQTFEQGDIELGFEALDLMTDRSLRHAQLDRRTGKTQVPRRSFKSPQGIQRQMRSDHS